MLCTARTLVQERTIRTAGASPLYRFCCGGIKWPRTVLSCLCSLFLNYMSDYRIRTWHLFITLWRCLSSTRSCSCSSNGWLDEGVAWSDRPTVGWATCDGVRWVTGRWLLMHVETELVWCAVSSPTTTAWRRRSEWRRWLDVDMGSRKWGVQTLSTLSTNMEPVHHNTNSQLHNRGNWYAR